MLKMQNRVLGSLGILVFSLGAVVGMAFCGSAVWADFEAIFFDSSVDADAPLKTLACPVMITAAETGTITAGFRNPTEKPIELTIRTHISKGLFSLIRESSARLSLAPREARELEWTVTPEDKVFGRLIFARVYQFPYHPLPSRAGTCGILVVNSPLLTGNQIVAATLAASLVSMALGAGLWVARNRPLSGRALDVARAMGAMAVVVLLGIVASLLGWWTLGALLFVIAVLLAVVMTAYFVLSA